MTPERWQQVKQLFNSAINYRPDERNVFLSKACSGDEDLRNEVESLIRQHEKSGAFIDAPAYEEAGALFSELGPELRRGQTIGSYEVVSFISRGGMGEVYLAQDRRLGRSVALKLLPAQFTEDEARLGRFEQEARAASALNHPNIITIYEIRDENSTLVIATEFVEGMTLRQRLLSGALDLNEALHVAIQIADALSAAHRAGIIHRDIKPENVMIRPDGYVKVLDFGLAKLTENASPVANAEVPGEVRTGTGVIMGTVGYMSPEQARGLTVDARSDIFNLGAVIYEMVAGKKAFAGETASDSLAAILTVEPPLLSYFNGQIPAELVRIVSKALRKDREERYQVVKDLLLDLKSVKEEIDFHNKLDRSVAPNKRGAADTSGQTQVRQTASTITHTPNAKFKLRRKQPSVAIAAFMVVIIAGGVGLYFLLIRSRRESAEAPQVVAPSQITFSPGLDGFPSLSPDGKSVAYSSDQSGSIEIYIKQLTPGGGELQLTGDGQQNIHPSWSADGQRIVYHSMKRGGIWLVSTLGGSPKQLVEFGSSPEWSSDGSTIAFQSGTAGEIFRSKAMPPSTIWIVAAEGGTPRQITKSGNPPGGHSTPSWSPDGKRIAFEVSDYLSSSVWSVALDGDEPKRIAFGSEPIYAPDGRHVYYIYPKNEGLSKIELSSTGEPISQQAAVSGFGPNLLNPEISADGKKILYIGRRTLSNLWILSLSQGSAALQGPPSVFLRDTSLRTNLVSFSPDGRKIALNRWRAGTSADIWVAEADGRNLIQVTNNPATDSQPNWFPEGDRLAFLSDRSNNRMMLWTISLVTGKEEPLLDLGDDVQYAQLSPDGQQVAFNSMQSGAMNIWVMTVKDGQRKQLTFDNEFMGFPSWSPDGKFLAFKMQRGANDYLMIVPSAGGQPEQLTFNPGRSWANSWSPDGDKIALSCQRDGVWNIFWISRSTKIQKQLTSYSKLNTFVRYPSWSPAGNQIVYEYAETLGNVWLAELK